MMGSLSRGPGFDLERALQLPKVRTLLEIDFPPGTAHDPLSQMIGAREDAPLAPDRREWAVWWTVANHGNSGWWNLGDELGQELMPAHVDVRAPTREMKSNPAVLESLDGILGERGRSRYRQSRSSRLRSRPSTVVAACRFMPKPQTLRCALSCTTCGLVCILFHCQRSRRESSARLRPTAASSSTIMSPIRFAVDSSPEGWPGRGRK